MPFHEVLLKWGLASHRPGREGIHGPAWHLLALSKWVVL